MSEEMKICSKCKIEKKYSEYYKDKSTKLGIKPSCKECVKEIKNLYKINNEEKIKEYNKNYNKRQDTKDRLNLKRKNNREKYNLINKKSREKNKDKISEKRKIYFQNNKEKLKLKARNYLKTNLNAKLAHNLRARFHDALKRKNITKNNSVIELIGCDINELITYLASKFLEGMSWDNYGEWHIDHIIPVSSFNLADIEEQNKCFNYTNLQPLWKYDNLKKSNKIIPTDRA